MLAATRRARSRFPFSLSGEGGAPACVGSAAARLELMGWTPPPKDGIAMCQTAVILGGIIRRPK